MSETRTVWGIGTSRTSRPIWALIELGLDFEHKKILPRSSGMDNPSLLAMSQRHKVPFYTDDRVAMGESAAIVTYLSERYGTEELLHMPAPGTAERAMIHDRTFFVMTEIDARLYTIRLHTDPPLGLCETYGKAPVAIDAAKQYVERQLKEAARWLEDGRDHVMGEHFSAIDVLLTSCLDWVLRYDMELPSPLGDYRDQVASRPGYKAMMAENDPSPTRNGSAVR